MSNPERIPRSDTGIRIALSLLFLLIAGVVELALRVLVGFSLIFALVTGEPPRAAVSGLANRLSAYLYRIYRYLSYNEARAPFPFAEFESVLEPPRWSEETTESELLRRSRGGEEGPGTLED